MVFPRRELLHSLLLGCCLPLMSCCLLFRLVNFPPLGALPLLVAMPPPLPSSFPLPACGAASTIHRLLLCSFLSRSAVRLGVLVSMSSGSGWGGLGTGPRNFLPLRLPLHLLPLPPCSPPSHPLLLLSAPSPKQDVHAFLLSLLSPVFHHPFSKHLHYSLLRLHPSD